MTIKAQSSRGEETEAEWDRIIRRGAIEERKKSKKNAN